MDGHHGALGPLVDTTLRVATWNLWWRFGPWEQRFEAIVATLREADADVVALQEVWDADGRNQAAELAEALGGYHHAYAHKYTFHDVGFGNAVLSRWPLRSWAARHLPTPDDEDEGRLVLRAEVDGPRGPLSVYCTHLHYRLHHSAIRQAQVRDLCAFVAETAVADAPAVLCGDFNAVPDSDEIRMLTGRTEPPTPDLVFRDVWEWAPGDDRGLTWDNVNPFVAAECEPDMRIDYLFVTGPAEGGRGAPVHARLLGDRPVDGVWPSDHFGVVADLRY